MKHFYTLFFACLFFLGTGIIQAQDQNNPWSIEIGVNAVDFYPTGNDAPLGGWFSQYFNTEDHWNVIPAISRVSVSRYIGDGFVFGVAGSANRLDSYGEQEIDDLSYYGLDGTISYSLRALLNKGWFDPHVGVGGGYTWIDQEGAGTLNGSLGFNFWFSDNIAFNIQSTYKHIFNEENFRNSHFQHVAGIKFVFGGIDTDGDGVYDKNDECPETPGLPEFNGCPDSDGDGIPDPKDACPDAAGLAEFDGCPDSDGDGIPDPKDECPQTAGLAKFNGCPDTDGDGIPDNKDECPEEAGPASNNGCPEPEPEVDPYAALSDYSRSVHFDLDKAILRPESKEALDKVAEILKEYPDSVFKVDGHTDNTYTPEYNMQLSKRRAEAVKEYLVSKGINEDRLITNAYGETQPVAPNDTAEGRQKNRRVEISFDEEKTMRD